MSRLSPMIAFGIAAAGIGVFSCMDAVMKGLALAIGAYTTLTWRNVAGTVLIGAVYLPRRDGWPTRVAMRLHLLRAVITAAMSLLFFWGLARVPMAQAISLAFIAPVIALILAGVILKERVSRAAYLATAIAMAGVIVIMMGQALAELGPEAVAGAIAVLASALCYAVNIVVMRAQSKIAGPVEITFWQTLYVAIIFLLAAPWFLTVPSMEHAPMIVLAAVLATVSFMLLAWAYGHGEASYLAPTEYTAFVWAASLGWIVFGERVSPWTVAGAALIVGGCVIAARAKPQTVPMVEAAP